MVKYTKAIGDKICQRISEGESLRSICKDKKLPSARMVAYWLADERYGDFLQQYMRAKEQQADNIFEEILEIVDDSDKDVQDRRLRMDARKWMAGKLRPKKYGDKTILAGDEENPLAVSIIERTIVDPKNTNS